MDTTKNEYVLQIVKQEYPMTYWFIENIERLKNCLILQEIFKKFEWKIIANKIL